MTLLALTLVVAVGAAAAPAKKPKPGTAPAKATAIEPVETVRALVMPTEVAEAVARAVDADQRRRIENDVTAILQRFRRLAVLTSQDVRNLADIDARRQLSGCDTSCASEIAEALGARYVFGIRIEAGAQGAFVLTVTLLDTADAVYLGKGRA